MGIKDTVVGLYVKKYVMPKSLILDKPGYVNFNVSGKSHLFTRQVIIPEKFFILLEKALISKFGNKGKQILYSMGKRFGYRFALIGNFVKKGDVPDGDLSNFMSVVTKFVEGTYALLINSKFDIEKSRVDYYIKDFVVVSKLGSGYYFPTGGAAGLIARMLNEKNIEGINLGIQNDGFYHLVCAKADTLKTFGKDELFFETSFEDLKVEPEYESRNQVQEFPTGSASFRDLLNARYFSYSQGIIKHNDERFFLLEVSSWYLLEKDLLNIDGGIETLFSSAFQTGKSIISSKSSQEAIQFLTATGWGSPTILSKKGKIIVVLKYVPWTKFYQNSKFVVLNGLLSGMLTSVNGKEIILSDPIVDVSSGSLTIQFQES